VTCTAATRCGLGDFSDPEVGTGRAHRTTGARQSLGRAHRQRPDPGVDRGWIYGKGNDGLVKLVEDTDRGVLVGATVVSPHGAQILGMSPGCTRRGTGLDARHDALRLPDAGHLQRARRVRDLAYFHRPEAEVPRPQRLSGALAAEWCVQRTTRPTGPSTQRDGRVSTGASNTLVVRRLRDLRFWAALPGSRRRCPGHPRPSRMRRRSCARAPLLERPDPATRRITVSSRSWPRRPAPPVREEHLGPLVLVVHLRATSSIAADRRLDVGRRRDWHVEHHLRVPGSCCRRHHYAVANRTRPCRQVATGSCAGPTASKAGRCSKSITSPTPYWSRES